VLVQDRSQGGHHGYVALAGIGFRRRARDDQPSRREIDVRTVKAAELGHAQATEQEGLHDRAPRDVVSPARAALLVPRLYLDTNPSGRPTKRVHIATASRLMIALGRAPNELPGC
jgi:hypothetical protein